MRSQLAAWLVLSALAVTAAKAETVPFTCTILPGDESVRIGVTNPAATPRSCLVSCRFSTPLWGGEAQIMCAHMVPQGAKDVEMCTKTSGGVKLVALTHGSADCIRPRGRR